MLMSAFGFPTHNSTLKLTGRVIYTRKGAFLLPFNLKDASQLRYCYLSVRNTRLELVRPKPTDFTYHYSFHYPFSLWSGLCLHHLLKVIRWVIIVSTRFAFSYNFARRWHQHYLLSVHRIYTLLLTRFQVSDPFESVVFTNFTSSGIWKQMHSVDLKSTDFILPLFQIGFLLCLS
jgi:hypothetical protein